MFTSDEVHDTHLAYLEAKSRLRVAKAESFLLHRSNGDTQAEAWQKVVLGTISEQADVDRLEAQDRAIWFAARLEAQDRAICSPLKSQTLASS